jgi:hypothetical protein
MDYYGTMTNAELLRRTHTKPSLTRLEWELASRLERALEGNNDGDHSRGQGQEGNQEVPPGQGSLVFLPGQ